MNKPNNTVLVAILPSIKDFEIAKTQNWYRVPIKKAPPILRKGEIKYIAFYFPKVFKSEQYSIKYYAEVKNLAIVNRKELFPGEDFNSKSENKYYKITFNPLQSLPKPIVSLRQRRLIFIPTSEEKFFNASEINHLFNDSKLEDILWAKFLDFNIPAERQYVYSVSDKYFFLDFAIFCKTGNINVQCDGDRFHTGYTEVQYDKNRNNLLASHGWSVLRFTTDNIAEEMGRTIDIVCETINKYGGVRDLYDENKFRLIRPDLYPQQYMFEEDGPPEL